MLPLLTFSTPTTQAKFEYLYNKYKRLLYTRAHGILKDHALAEDAVSEAYMRAYKHIHNIGDKDSPQTISFLVTIVKNIAINMYHKEKRTATTDFTTIQTQYTQDSFNLEETIVLKDHASQSLKLLDHLKEEQRAVFLLKYAHDLTHKEIARLLNTTENNVTVRLHRAKAKLSKIIAKEAKANV